MAIDLKKRLVDLSQKAAFAVNQHGIEGQRVQVVLVLDISASMNALYKSGVVQRIIERMLGLAVNFDDDGQIDLLLSSELKPNCGEPSVSRRRDIAGFISDSLSSVPKTASRNINGNGRQAINGTG